MPKAIRFHEIGEPEVLRLEDVVVGEPGPGDARVRHTAVGVNYIDIYHRTGLYPLPLPSGLGVEGVGIVEAVGAGVTNVRVGDRVAYAGPPGSYAEARNVAADRLVALPGGVDDRIAGAIMTKGTGSGMSALIANNNAVNANSQGNLRREKYLTSSATIDHP
jgi:NADPH2:quinone reductase